MGKYDIADKVAPVVQAPGVATTSVTISGQPRATFEYKATFNSNDLTRVTITKAAADFDTAWAERLAEMASLVKAINATADETMHAALKTRIQEID